MNPNSTSAMVALLPTSTDWCKIQPAHLTLAYLGELDTLKFSDFNEVAKSVASIAQLSNTVAAKVTGVEVLGDAEKVDALMIESTQELLAMRAMLEDWDVSDFPFNPHCTIGPVGSASSVMVTQPLPIMLFFDRISVWWGDKVMPFWLRKY